MKYYLLFLINLFIAFQFLAQVDSISVYFDVDEYQLDEAELKKLRSINHKSIEILSIHSFCDTTGTIEHNKELSKKRANWVNNILRNTQNKPSIKYYGESLSPNNLPLSKQRRVDIIYQSLTEKTNVSLKTNFETFIKDTTSTNTTIQLFIHFHPGTDSFLDPNDPQLLALYDILKNNEKVEAHIRGHVCCSSNQTLSHQRAYRVYRYMVKHGISPNRLSYKGYSNTIPLVYPEITEADRIKNRRVDIVFKKQ